jgi:hypothetical protein
MENRVVFFDKIPPYGALAAAKITGTPLEAAPDASYPKGDPAVLKLAGG